MIKHSRTNPVDELKRLGWPHEHVTFDPALKKGRYYIRRGSAHDGTQVFTEELVEKVLYSIATQASYYKPDAIDISKIKGIRYRVGWLRRAAVFGIVDLPVGRYPGQREAVRLQVVPEYVPRDDVSVPSQDVATLK